MLSFKQYLLETSETHDVSTINLDKNRPWINLKKQKVHKNTDLSILKPNEKYNVQSYTSSKYFFINNYLRDKLKGKTDSHYDKDTQWDAEGRIAHISSALQQSRMKHDVWLHHGMKEPPNSEKVARGFMSTTLNPHLVPNFTFGHYDSNRLHFLNASEKKVKVCKENSEEHAKLSNDKNWEQFYPHHVLHIHAPKHSHALYIAEISNHPTENEVLLHHGARIKIHPKPRYSMPSKKTGGVSAHWFGKLVHDGIEPTRHAKGDK